MHGTQWIIENWYMLATPLIIFLCIFIVGLVLRKVILANYDHRAAMPGHGTDRPMILAVLNAFVLWCFLVGVTIATNLCLPSADSRAFINNVATSFFFISLAWLIIAVIGILFRYNAPEINAVLTRPIAYLVQTFIRAAVITAAVLVLFMLWELSIGKPYFAITIGSILILFAVIDLIRTYQPDAFVRGLLKILLFFLAFCFIADMMRRLYMALTDIPDDPFNMIIIIIEVCFLILFIALLHGAIYAASKPGALFACFFGAFMLVVLVSSGVEPFATDSATAATLARNTIDKIPEFVEGKPTVYTVSVDEDMALLAIEKETFRLVNEERKKVGAPELSWSDSIHNVARLHSKNMLIKGKLYHNALGIFSECCFGSSDLQLFHRTGKTVVDSFMSSTTGHKEAMLADDCTVGAVGIAQNEKGFFATLRLY